MIKLIRGDGEAQYIEPSHFMVIQKTDEGAQIHFRDGKWMIVKESPEEVARKVLEWKLAMADYQDSSGEYRQMIRKTLEGLAGLHDKKLDAIVDGIVKRMEDPNHDT